MNYQHVKDTDKEQEEKAAAKFRRANCPSIISVAVECQDKIEMRDKLTAEINRLDNDIKNKLCGHQHLVMEVGCGMTSYHDKSGNFRSMHGTCEQCGKEFHDEFKADDEYYEVWNGDVY